MKNILVIMPALNEEANIEKVVLAAKRALNQADILVVDDGSRDQTARKARLSGAKVISHPFNLGYGAALQTGYKYAESKPQYQYILQMDADGQHEPNCLKEILVQIQKSDCDLVVGSRFLDANDYSHPFLKKIGTGFFGKLASLVLKQRVTDPTSGFRAMNRRTLSFLSQEFYPSDYPDTDVIITLYRNGYRLKEMPITVYPRLTGKSRLHNGLKPIYYVFKMGLSIGMIFLRKKRQL